MLKQVTLNRRSFVRTVAMTLSAARFGISAAQVTKLPNEGRFPSLQGATAWLNSKPLSEAELRGKVALIDFWTYTCINWRRTAPYIRAWNNKYRDHGLVVIGVHTPEFSFEHDINNVRRNSQDMQIDYPIAVDSDYAIWRAFDNEYWPALYFGDAKGRIRYHYFGEGEYAQSEKVIQQLLREAGATGFNEGPVVVNAAGPELAAEWADLESAENYLGYERTENFSSPGSAPENKSHDYALPAQLELNHWALSGPWTRARDQVSANAAGCRIAYRFHARDLHLVMGPSTPEAKIRFRVTIDGQPAVSARGTDIDEQGNGVVAEPRMYHLIRQSTPIIDRRFEIEFLDPGVKAYVFTFG